MNKNLQGTETKDFKETQYNLGWKRPLEVI